MAFQTVFIWPNMGKPHIVAAIEQSCALIRSQQAAIILPDVCRTLSLSGTDIIYLSREEGVRRCDFILSLGGDGTMLHMAELAAAERKPMIGVNLGHVGFMTELEFGELSKINQVFQGKYSVDCRMMLELRVQRQQKILYRQTALNDVTLSKANPFRVIRVDIRAGGVPVTRFSGDGVIAATPTGSTGYSLSAGGAILEPSAENIVVTPICAHNFFAKSIVFAPDREISITAAGPDGSNVCVSTDGRDGFSILPSDRIFIRKARMKTQLLRVKGKSFYHILQQKLSGRE